MSATQKRFAWWIYWVILALIVVFGWLPLITTGIAVGIANQNGCQISEGLLTPCVIDGVDRGGDLQAYGNSFWLVLVTWPASFVMALVWGIVLFFHRRSWRRHTTVRP